MTPGLQTSLKFQSYVHATNDNASDVKNFDQFKNAEINISINRPILKDFDYPDELRLRQRVYRLSSRKMNTTSIEEFTISACHDTLLNDAKSLVTKSWKCASPSTVVQDVLTQCAGVSSSRLDVESTSVVRSYIADNIHPFQVVAEQANVALADGNDPSFIHYMTYENNGTHKFKSLKNLIKQAPVATFSFAEGGQYADPNFIMSYNFPCDFDLLSDLLNGIDENGREINSIAVVNPFSGQWSLFGSQVSDCGIGSGNIIHTFTNQQSGEEHNMCDSGVEKYRLRRQARMNLLEQDKIALRIIVPWNPVLNAGKTIDVKLFLKSGTKNTTPLYGSGKYLIASLVHNIKNGGYSTTTLDCISETSAKSGAV